MEQKPLKEKLEEKGKPDKKRVSIYVRKTFWEMVENVAKKYKMSVSETAEELMEEGMDQLKIQEQNKSEDEK